MNSKLKEYAKLIIEVGLNIRDNQMLTISAPVSCAEFVRYCVDAAYDRGARDVTIDWNDDYISRQHWLRAKDDVFDSVPSWYVDKRMSLAKSNGAYLSIAASDPENLKGVPSDRLQRNSRANNAALDEFYTMLTNNAFSWCIVSIPTAAWAKKVFPTLSENDAVEKLWYEIFRAVRVDGSGNAVSAWKKHCDFLKSKCDILNSYNFKELHYKNSLGTDLTIGLPEGHIWAGGSDTNSTDGREFIANMPTEEVYTAPQRNKVNGIVYASKPLAVNGDIVRDFYFVIKDGKITEAHAKEGEDVLLTALDEDETSRFLGEVALVPYNSPISDSGVLFYETLFDENASCHLAFGEAYNCCIKGGENMSHDELMSHGLNCSNAHCDFMIGTSDLSIIGTTHDGKEIEVFRDGNFAI